MRPHCKTFLLLATLLVPAACDAASDPGPAAGSNGGSSNQNVTGSDPRGLGKPIPGLTPEELAAFDRGRLVFERRFRPSIGLGPFYNATSCRSCHSEPITGGSAQLYRNFFIAMWGTLSVQGAIPPFLSPVVPAFGSGADHATTTQFTLQGGRTVIPDTFNGFTVFRTQRNAPPLFGVGLFEFVNDATILSREDAFDTNGDGISGRHNIDFGAVGRFGYKAQSNNIEVFTRAPFQNQLGVTSNPFLGAGAVVHMLRAPMVQASGDPTAPTVDHDAVPDPEMPHADLGDVIAFTRFLGAPQPLPFDAAATNGETLFAQVRCTDCHVPELPSSRGPIRPYTDLLVHYMGDALADNIKMGANGSTALEFRTQPLWGVSLHAPFLHDGRAETLMEAIDAHGGEALTSHNLFFALTPAEQADVISFLEHL
jgi:CxxC motif-containing protein (DUF1111 family)